MDARARWIWEKAINPPTDVDEANSSFGLNPAADAEFLLTLLVADLFISQWEKWIGYLVPKGADIFFAYLLSCPFIHHLGRSRLPIFSFSHFLVRAYGKESS